MWLHVVAGVARVKFLTLTLLCVALGAVLSWYQTGQIKPGTFGLVLLVALCAHISVNAFNEYFDFRSGLDLKTSKTPFSGGSGALVAAPGYAPIALVVAIVSLILTLSGGLMLAVEQGMKLLLIGLPGVLLIYFYTQTINRMPILCFLAPGIGFGLLMTLGACWVFSGLLTTAAWLLSSIMALLVSDLLLLNQFPDVEADKTVGRRHIPILYGRVKSARLFAVVYVAAFLLLLFGVATGLLPWPTLFGLAVSPLLLKLLRELPNKADNMNELIPLLGLNVMIVHVFPLGIIAGLIISALAGI